ncbi:BRCT domain-containing protein, a BRCA1 C-terminus domain-containing protein [Microdochium nivale]|nr:BRCT domain-containing protein, a BRCA1 C-terminus domain-containing protein [Microdochium nivale]
MRERPRPRPDSSRHTEGRNSSTTAHNDNDSQPQPPPPRPPVVVTTTAVATRRPSSRPRPLDPTKAAEPVLSRTFDPWNSSATGHQRAENRLLGSTGWRDSRNSKLMAQYSSRGTGGQRISDSVGAGSSDYDSATQQLVRPEARFRVRHSVLSMLAKPGSMKAAAVEFAKSSKVAMPVANTSRSWLSKLSSDAHAPSLSTALTPVVTKELSHSHDASLTHHSFPGLTAARKAESSLPLFAGVMVYVNGSTHPLISDHRLKQLLAEHGGSMSIHLGRRKVTHVILGRPSVSSLSSGGGGGGAGGAGGGLASGKLQREIQKVRGCAVKYVGVEWVLESVRAGKRLPEARFSNLKVASSRQQSVYGLSSKPPSPPSSYMVTTDDTEPPPSAQRSQ